MHAVFGIIENLFPLNQTFIFLFTLLLCCSSRAPVCDGQPARTPSSLSRSPSSCLTWLRLWFRLKKLGVLGVCGSVLGLGSRSLPVGPVSPMTNRWWHLWAGGLRDTLTGDRLAGRHEYSSQELFHPISSVPAVPRPPMEAERRNVEEKM